MEALLSLIEKFGLPVVLLTMFIVWAYNKDKRQEKRYDELGKKMDDVQGEQRQELIKIANKSLEVQIESNKVQKELCDALHTRPCIARTHD